MINPLSRRGFLAISGGTATGLALALGPGTGRATAAQLPDGTENEEAKLYYRLLLRHTRWVESRWDERTGHYPVADRDFVVVLGNAVLLTLGDYDAELAGIDRDTLREHTLRGIRAAAPSNFFATGATWGDGGYEWGGPVFWDGTFESYLVAAAHLLWDELDVETRQAIDAIAIGDADYVASLGPNEDPRSGGWSSNGLAGGFRTDSKIEEMGAKSMPLATGLAYFPDHPNAPGWHDWLTRWMSNMTGLPAADAANNTLLDGRPVSAWNQAHNVHDTYIVENHASYAPHYQESLGAYPGRNAIHFLLAGQALPDVFANQPNADGLWRTLRHLGVAAGLSAHPMVADRHHLYGRDVLPATWRRVGQGDRFLARSETMLMKHLEPYLLFPPENRLTKFSGEPKYEGEARCEVAIAYLLHRWRHRLHDVSPVSDVKYWADSAGARDYGPNVGLVAHQSPESLSLVVTKPGFSKLAFLPEHDDWFFDVAGSAPGFLPSPAATVLHSTTRLYERATDGFDATATVLRLAGGFAGFTTLPGGAVVYTSSGHSADEGALRLHALTMPGVPGLDGNRTFSGQDGTVTLTAEGGDGGTDELSFPAVRGRHVRMLGVRPGSQFGYSLWSFEVFAPGSDTDLARGRPTTVSSHEPLFPPQFATDGDPATRWAVIRQERPRPDSWIAVDLGEVVTFDRARLVWDPAFGAEYRIQVSPDGTRWTDAVSVPQARTFPSGWVNVDDRAGFVVRGGRNPIRATAKSLTLSAGPATGSAGMVIEGYAAMTAEQTARAAERMAATAEPAGLAASTAAGHLSVFNLTAKELSGAVRIPRASTAELTLYAADQRVRVAEHLIEVRLAGASAQVLPPAFELSLARPGDRSSAMELQARIPDRRTLVLTNMAFDDPLHLTVRCLATGRSHPVTLHRRITATLRFDGD